MAPSLPRHVAIVMDGNGRWARRRLMPRLAGHRQGLSTLRKMVGWCLERHIAVMTVFAFSSENWRRPSDEVSGLMGLLMRALGNEVPELSRQGVRLCCPGERGSLPTTVREGIERAERETMGNQRMVLNVCFNYGGRWDVVQAAQRLQQAGEAITEAGLAQHLALSHVPDPDLLIRTGGEQRLSNFLLWQAAYAELYFSPVWWPDFDEAEFERALAAFAARERRFGQTSEQVLSGQGTAAGEA